MVFAMISDAKLGRAKTIIVGKSQRFFETFAILKLLSPPQVFLYT
jgi:hypothetical protein